MSRLFSSAVFREMAKRGRSATFARLFSMTGVTSACTAKSTVGDCFDLAFAVLKKAAKRDEYVYRAAVTQKILIGRHSLSTACMLTEFRAGSCRADLVILNGTATVFEIKSERDSLARLANQLTNYRRVFAAVNVIASEAHAQTVLKTVPDDVGVLCLSRRHQIQLLREAKNQPGATCPIAVFESLRSIEAQMVLRKLRVRVPSVPNTQMHAAMRTIFAELEPVAVQMAMVSVLKQTRALSPLSKLIDQLPESLHTAALSVQVRRSEHDCLVRAVSTPLTEAFAWT
jgi:hypothetical protein